MVCNRETFGSQEKIMKTKLSLDDTLKSLSTPHPARDWLIALGILSLLFIGLATYAAYLFSDIRWGNGTDSGAAVAPRQVVTKAQLDAEIQKYQARQDAFEARDFGLPKLYDPAQ